MLDAIIKAKSRIHSRDISLATWPHENMKVIVHGILKDIRYIDIFDVTGKMVETRNQQAGNSIVLNTENWNKGLFFIHVSNNNNTYTVKVIKN